MLNYFTRTMLFAIAAATIGQSTAQETPGKNAFDLVTVNGEPISGLFLHYFTGGKIVGNDEMPRMLNMLVNSMILAQEAEKEKLADNPDVKTLLRAAQVKVLSDAYINKFIAKTTVSEDEVDKFYEGLKESMRDQKEYKIAHILVDSEEKAKELAEEADNDLQKFSELAREHSIDTRSRPYDGELGWMNVNASNFIESFATAVKELDKEEFSEPVQSQFGWHLIYLADFRPLEVPPLDDEMRSHVEGAIKQQKLQIRLAELSQNADVQHQHEAATGDEPN